MMASKKNIKKKPSKKNSKIKVGLFLRGKRKLSKVQLGIVVIIFIAVGGYILDRSFADTVNINNINFPPVAIADAGTNNGYILAASDGGIFAYGTAAFHGSMGGITLSAPVVGVSSITSNGTDTGYYMVGSDGAVYAFGSAQYKGGANSPNTGNTGSFVAIAADPNGGYWLLDSTGQIYAYGGAPYYGGSPVNYSGNFVGIAATTNGGGYWLVTSSGEVYAYGNAPYGGNAPAAANDIVGITAANNGGYWLVGADGGVFSFAGATFHGSMSGTPLNAPVVGITHTNDYGGYWLAAKDGGIFSFGDAVYVSRPAYTPPAPALVSKSVSVYSGQSVSTNVVSGVANSPAVSSLVIVQGASHGSSSVSSGGVINYTSAPGYTGADSVTYQVCSSIVVIICARSTINYQVIALPVVVQHYAASGGSSSAQYSAPGGSSSADAKAHLGGGDTTAYTGGGVNSQNTAPSASSSADPYVSAILKGSSKAYTTSNGLLQIPFQL